MTLPIYKLDKKYTTPQPTVPTAITFNWTTCKDRPEGIKVLDYPVAINGKVCMRGLSNWTDIVRVYTPDQESWNELRCPPLSVIWFTVATLRGQLLVVGGQEKSTKEKANTILTFHERSRQWVKLLPPMPKALIVPKVVEYQNMQSYRYRWIWHK